MIKVLRASRLVRSGVEYALLTAAFFLGIGVVALLLRAFGVRLMEREPVNSAWTNPSGGSNMNRMY